jgi:hypothetical protein
MKRPSTANRGVLLIELLVCMAIGTVLVAVVTTVLVRIVVMNPAAQEHLNSTVGLARLAGQFRTDVHAANEALPEQARLEMRLADRGKIQYELTGNGLRRTRFEDDKATQSETYELPSIKILGWKMLAPGEVSLTVGRLIPATEGEAEIVKYQFPITARLGRDQRFVSPDELKNASRPNE